MFLSFSNFLVRNIHTNDKANIIYCNQLNIFQWKQYVQWFFWETIPSSRNN